MAETNETRSLSLSNLDQMDGHEFENLIAKLMENMGFVTEERKLSVDGGIDILAENYEPILEGKYVIQCKRQSKKVEEHIIRDLYGVVHSRNANKGILITNSTFTDSALKFAQNKQLELIDGEKLHALLVKYRLKKLENEVILPNSSRFLLNTFVPSLSKICKEFDDTKNGLVYVEKNSCPLQKWLALCKLKLNKLSAYCQFITKTINQCFERVSIENDNLERIRESSFRIMEATRKIVNDYKEVLGVIPPKGFEKAHLAFTNFYLPIFASLQKFMNDIKAATVNPEPKIYEISVVFSIDEEGKMFNYELAKATESFT